CSESPARQLRRPLTGFTPGNGRTPHLVGVGNNRIGKYQSFSQGLLVDLTSAPAVNGIKSRSVGYVLNDGWNWNDATWAQPTPAKAVLGDLLIEQDSGLARSARLRRHRAAA
ncbi:hypothetical protein VSX64_19815, partial [Aurantimonas sp. C2-6-R+9]|nr:hypothetical protein [Aurantimonas sp. C2-6-R+9]